MVTDFANDPALYDTITRKFSSPLLVVLIDLAGVISYFSISLAIINSGAHIMYKVGHDGLLPRWTAWLHSTRLNPVAAITAICIFGLAIGLIVGFAMSNYSGLLVFQRDFAHVMLSAREASRLSLRSG